MTKKSSILNIVLCIFLIIFIISVARSLFGGQSLSFSGFLNSLDSVPSIKINWTMIDGSIGGSWGIFDFFRTFLNSVIVVVNVLVYMLSLLLNLLIFLAWSVKFLFV